MSDTRDAEWDALLCLTAFDVLWAHVSPEAIKAAEDAMTDEEREVIQRAVDMSSARRLAEGLI